MQRVSSRWVQRIALRTPALLVPGGQSRRCAPGGPHLAVWPPAEAACTGWMLAQRDVCSAGGQAMSSGLLQICLHRLQHR